MQSDTLPIHGYTDIMMEKPITFFDEYKALLNLSWPLILTWLLNSTIAATSLLFCGQLGGVSLGAVSLANSVLNVTGISVGMGLTTACDTLFSQTFGSENKKKMGIFLQKSILILTLAAFPCWAIHVNTENILLIIGQNETVAKIAGRYNLIFMPGLIFNFYFQVLSKYLQNQNIVIPFIFIGLAGNIVNIILHYFLIFKTNLGVDGSAIAQVFGHFTFMTLSYFYTIFKIKSNHGVTRLTWNGWSLDCLRDWKLFFLLGLPGILMVCLEWWCFEIGTILSGTLDTVELGAQSILFQMEGITYMVPTGIAVATSIRIGQFLGAGQWEYAKMSSRVGLSSIGITSIVIGILYGSLRYYIPRAFSKDEKIINTTADIFPILGAFCVFDGIAAVGGGILRGCGRQSVGAIVIFIGYYVIALPIGIPLLLLTNYKVKGLWIAYAIGVAVEALAFLLLVLTTSWKMESEIALQRGYVNPESKPLLGEKEDKDDESEKMKIKFSELKERRYSKWKIIDDFHKRRFSVAVMQPTNETPVKFQIPGKMRRYSTRHVPQIQKSVIDKINASNQNVSLFKLIVNKILIFGLCFGTLIVSIFLRVFCRYEVAKGNSYNSTTITYNYSSIAN